MGYQAKKSNPPEKRNPPKGGSNVTPPPKNESNVAPKSTISRISEMVPVEEDSETWDYFFDQDND